MATEKTTKADPCNKEEIEPNAVKGSRIPLVSQKQIRPDGRSYTPPYGVVIEPPPPPPKLPPGPPRPSSDAKGSLSINRIHQELRKIYVDCIEQTNAAFRGDPPDPGDTTHNHIHKNSNATLKPRNDWRCAPGTGWAGNEWCNDVTMEYETVCQVPVVPEEGYFQCENVNVWFVQLNNFFHYKLDFGFGISRSLYQTCEIRVYCDGWIPNMAPGTGGKIKVVQLPPIESYGPAGTWENLLGAITFGWTREKVKKGLKDQYLGNVSKMVHIINDDKLSGFPATSLGIDGNESTPLNERNIIWDIPQPVVASEN